MLIFFLLIIKKKKITCVTIKVIYIKDNKILYNIILI